MLNVLRQKAGSWVVKVLLLLLVVSFAIWGIGDVFFGGVQNPTVATVGSAEISAGELADAFNRSLNNLQQRLGRTVDREQAIQLGLMQQALQDLIARRLIDQRARDMGLTVADDTLRQLVTEDPLFHSAGQFDRQRFEQLLRANGMTEQGYLASLRQDVVRSTLTGSIAGPVAAPAGLVDAIYRYRNEERRGHYVAIKASSITDLPEPSEDDLAAFHNANEDTYTTPEYRRLTFITLAAEDLIDEVDVSEAEVEAEYQALIDTYRTPERRTVEQLLAPNGAAIEKAAQQVAEGASFDEVAETLSTEGVSVDDLGQVTATDLPPAQSEAIFALAEGEVSRPVESPFGWHLFKVSEILPEEVVPLAQARDEIARELALAEARDRLPNFATQLDDELAAGQSLAEAAAAVGLEARSVAAIDPRGNDPEGRRPPEVPDWPEFLTLAFETPAGEPSLLEETEAGGYFVLQVDEIVPPSVKPVDEVRPQLVAAWQADKRRELARQKAEDLLTRLQDGASLDELAVAENLTVTPIEPVKRGETGADQGINQAVVRALFATPPGRPAEPVIALGESFTVVATDEVIDADPAADRSAVERLEVELEADMRNDLLAQFETQLRREYPVAIDGAAFNRVIGADGLLPAGAAGTLPRPTAPL
ncbi:MAG TPA: SurA N-terminal domain-containing protein [Geminicoccaceae bacterium]|nr:SurA N-terminal domain-containing protein [Geminicoccaceae bacterium]